MHRRAIWRTLARAATRALLAAFVLALAGLGSYDLEASKPHPPASPVDRLCPQRFQSNHDGATGLVPLCLSVPDLAGEHPAIASAIIVLHGASRNAVSAYDTVEKMVREAQRTDTLVVAPQFLVPLDRGTHGTDLGLAVWRSAGWSQGDRSEIVPDGPTVRVSSFEVLDRLIEELADPARFPSLREIVVAGHSAGAQFVQRYAAGSRVEDAPSVARRGLTFRYVVANPSSFLYLFPRPSDPLVERCPRYDEYKYGLLDLNAYLSGLGPDGLRAEYAKKNVTLLLGGLDFEMIDPSKDDSCAAVAQGAHRQTRGYRFFQHLEQGYGPGGHGTTLVRVPGVRHSLREMLLSPEGRAALLGIDHPHGADPSRVVPAAGLLPSGSAAR
jgi:hypothetical protein